jgi:hypothetical protein
VEVSPGRERNHSTSVSEDTKTSSQVMDKAARRKLRQETYHLNSTISQLDSWMFVGQHPELQDPQSFQVLMEQSLRQTICSSARRPGSLNSKQTEIKEPVFLTLLSQKSIKISYLENYPILKTSTTYL